jgi:hypothetical protein
MTTYFAAPMTCPYCGVRSPGDSTTDMQTSLIHEPGVQLLRVGDVVSEIRAELKGDFISLRPPPEHGPIVILQEWSCATCKSRRFAHVVFEEDARCEEDGRLARIEAVPLTSAALDAAHFAYDGLAELYQEILGEPLYVDNAIRPDFIERLRAKLPDRAPRL